MKNVEKVLKEMNITYKIINHPAALTTEEANLYIEGKEGVRSKTMFMSGKKNRKFYLIIMDDKKRLNIKTLNNITNNKLQFGSVDYLMEKMELLPGMVSLFGLINNHDKDINVYIDSDILKEKIITFHPNINTATVFIEVEDMLKFIKNLNYDYQIIEI